MTTLDGSRTGISLHARAADASADRPRHGDGPATATTGAKADFPIIIIGAGFAGIGMAIRLLQQGIDSFLIVERAGEVGGTWRDNTYPGAACDIPSHLYCLSFEPNPDWSSLYPKAPEIQAYLLRLVDKWNLRPHLRLNSAVTGARFDESKGLWHIETAAGDPLSARVVISAVGGLVDPSFPEIPGLDRFRGKVIHTARWDHTYPLLGKRVAVVGTGASAVQVIPAIAPKVGRLTVFQRTAAWVVKKGDVTFSERARRTFAKWPWLQKFSRAFFYLFTEAYGPLIILNSRWLSRIVERQSLAHLRNSVHDPGLRERLTPRFQFGCKRMLISDDYWPTFERDNVDLVTAPISEITETGIRTTDGAHHPLDAIVLATGFHLNIGKAPFPVEGRGGSHLGDAWRNGGVAYKGVAIAGFPNWFVLMGPNTGPGHTSVLVYTEAQISYVLQAIDWIRSKRLKFVDVKAHVQARYNDRLQARMPYTTWSSGCQSWYLSPDGKNRSLFPGLAGEYVLSIRNFRPAEYDTAPQVPAA